MTLPNLLLGVMVAAMIGSLFHLWRGGSLGRLLLYLLLSTAGFFIGHFVGTRLGITFLQVGRLHVGAAVIGSLVVLGVGYWLSLIQVKK